MVIVLVDDGILLFTNSGNGLGTDDSDDGCKVGTNNVNGVGIDDDDELDIILDTDLILMAEIDWILVMVMNLVLVMAIDLVLLLVFGIDSVPILFRIGIILVSALFIVSFVSTGVLYYLLGSYYCYLIINGYVLKPYL